MEMSWSQINPCFTYFYPFYDYAFVFESQKHSHLQGRCGIASSDFRDNLQNLKSYDTQAQLGVDKSEQKGSVQVKKRSVRKEKMLKKREREDNFERKIQKKDRNLPSNIFKYFASYLYTHPAQAQVLQMLSNHHVDINPQKFISKLSQSIKQTQSYIRPAIIQKLCGEQILNKNESLCFRILLRRFLLLDLPVLISPMQKYKKRQRRELINLARKLFTQIKQKYSQ